MWDNGEVIFFSETKTKWNISPSDLVEEYKMELDETPETPSALVKAVEQVFGYLAGGKLQYGAMSTYDYTWFLKRPKASPGCLQVSDRIANSSIGPSVLKCYIYAISLAMEDPDSTAPPDSERIDRNENNRPPSDDDNDPSFNGDDGSSNDDINKNQYQKTSNRRTRYNIIRRGGVPGAGKKRVSLESYGWNDYEMMDVLGCGRSGAVYRALFPHEIVAIKACDIWQVPHYEAEILNEIDIYMALERLQGDVIPRFKGGGYSAGGLLLLITKLVGSPIDTNNLSDSERWEIMIALSRIHSEGVIHNDIRPENILIERHPKSFTIKIIDFALSKKSMNKNEAEREMRSLKWMLGYRSTDQQKKRNWEENNGRQNGNGGATKGRGKRHRLCSHFNSDPDSGCLQGGKENAVVGKDEIWCG
jgi:hypothetical protein